MCGITFLFDPESEAKALEERTKLALASLVHRGPDGSGLWFSAPTAIGHRRLAVIDIEHSRQPITDRSGRFVLAYNGEIYNYRDLRSALSPHWEFQTSGDTEVLLAGLVTKGESFLNQLEGMWSFAFWDSKARQLLLSRDRMGKKPLFFSVAGPSFACASELPALRLLTASHWDECDASTADYLRYGYYLPGTTAYRGVREVLPGQVLRWSPDSDALEVPYWQLRIDRYTGSYRQACTEVKERMIRSIRRRLVADVEVGAFLSGGLDSSLIVGILSEEIGVRPKTFTIGFAEKTFDESAHAKRVSRHWGTDHHEHQLESWDPQLLIRLVRDHVGQPFYDSSLLPTALVSALAARHVKVALTGDGGDELFSGYQRYQARSLLRWYTRLPQHLREAGRRLVLRLPEPSAHHSRSLLKKAHLFFDVLDRHRAETPYVAPVFYSHEQFAALAPDLGSLGHTPRQLPQECGIDDLGQMMVADSLTYLPQDILAKVDRASMAFSLEARCPFLDTGLVELAFSFPRSWHRCNFRGKRMLRNTFANLLPRFIGARRKQGFAVPTHVWFRNGLLQELEALLQETPSALNRGYVLRMLRSHQLGKRDHGYRLWGLYVYLLWLKDRQAHAY